MGDKDGPVEYLGLEGVARWFGVAPKTVSSWRVRYADTHPIPDPDVVVEGRYGWAPGREAEWRAWYAGRPGQGAGGGPKRRGSSGG